MHHLLYRHSARPFPQEVVHALQAALHPALLWEQLLNFICLLLLFSGNRNISYFKCFKDQYCKKFKIALQFLNVPMWSYHFKDNLGVKSGSLQFDSKKSSIHLASCGEENEPHLWLFCYKYISRDSKRLIVNNKGTWEMGIYWCPVWHLTFWTGMIGNTTTASWNDLFICVVLYHNIQEHVLKELTVTQISVWHVRKQWPQRSLSFHLKMCLCAAVSTITSCLNCSITTEKKSRIVLYCPRPARKIRYVH